MLLLFSKTKILPTISTELTTMLFFCSVGVTQSFQISFDNLHYLWENSWPTRPWHSVQLWSCYDVSFIPQQWAASCLPNSRTLHFTGHWDRLMHPVPAPHCSQGACPRKGVIDLTIVKVEDVPSEMEPFPCWRFTELQRSLHKSKINFYYLHWRWQL